MVYFLLLLLVFIAALTAGWYRDKTNKEALLKHLNGLVTATPGFKISKYYIHPKALSCIAIDDNSNRILVACKAPKGANNPINSRLLKYADIINCDVLVDAQVVGSKSIGGVLAVGALLANTKYTKRINEVSLKIVVRDVINPTVELLFYRKTVDGGAPNDALKAAENWKDTLTAATLKTGLKAF